MIETKEKRVKYIIQYQKLGEKVWNESDYSDGGIADLNIGINVLTEARENTARISEYVTKTTIRKYRLIKETYFMTMEVIDE